MWVIPVAQNARREGESVHEDVGEHPKRCVQREPWTGWGGAALTSFSQYPAEREFLFPPLCALEVLSTRVIASS